MTDEKLAYMANQIATAFRANPSEAAAAVADHINKFWEPRMRAQLLARLEAGGAGLDATVIAAGPAIRRPASADA
ncbi:MAG: formate dehydrogenase subunit delta [Paracoccaceae bacterium]|jgi:formate dehydrogenase subunit delta|nr:formate dehydrogenase subunit delta [Paracoccaceae bacterium]